MADSICFSFCCFIMTSSNSSNDSSSCSSLNNNNNSNNNNSNSNNSKNNNDSSDEKESKCKSIVKTDYNRIERLINILSNAYGCCVLLQQSPAVFE